MNNPHKQPRVSVGDVALGAALAASVFVGGIFFLACTTTQEAKFVDAAHLVCGGLEEFEELHNDILSVHMLMERGDYKSALKVADELLASVGESKDVRGLDELHALIILLQSIVKDHPQ